MSIKLLALDLDGTLLDSEKKMPVDFLPWVREHSEIRTVIASGRQYYTILRDFPVGRDNITIIAENGGLVFDENNEKIYMNSMKSEDVKASLDRVMAIPGATPIVCGEKSAYILDVSDEIFNQTGVYYARIKRVDDLYEYVDQDNVLKIAIFFSDRDAASHLADLQDLEGDVSAVLSGERWIDIANTTVNKGTAIEHLLDMFDIDRSEAAAFGDYLNDKAMLEACEESYCMSNGHEELKAIAKYIAPSNDEEGVMKVLRGTAFYG